MTVFSETVLAGDCRALMPLHGPFDLILADPPYGDTSLAWDRRVDGFGGAQNVETGRARELKIGQNREVAARAQLLDGGGAVGGFVHGVAAAPKGFAQHGSQLVFVFDEEQGFHVTRIFPRKTAGIWSVARRCAER